MVVMGVTSGRARSSSSATPRRRSSPAAGCRSSSSRASAASPPDARPRRCREGLGGTNRRTADLDGDNNHPGAGGGNGRRKDERIIHDLIGTSARDILWWQESIRAVIIFGIGLVLLRFFGRRAFGRQTPLDILMAIWSGPTSAAPSREMPRSFRRSRGPTPCSSSTGSWRIARRAGRGFPPRQGARDSARGEGALRPGR